ncbi:MAG: hypothetical protein LBP37_04220 [Spirochaetaceae bacterium]|jgi:hypothetical protein|nr:hypothetical protein [Spirochaetaceae bacterium]
MSSVAKYALDNPNAIKNMSKDIRKAIKTAATQAVNATAFEARENLKTYVQENFNNPAGLVTGKALFVTKAAFGHTENLGDIHAGVGFSEKVDFMKRQDEGGWHTPKEPSKKLRILTDAAKRDGLPTIHIGKRGKQTIRGKAIHTILLKKGRSQSHKSNRVARAYMAHKTGLLMYLGPNNSLFRVTDFQAVDGKVQFQTEMFVNRAYEKTYTRARNFFMPECKKAAEHIQDLFNENMDKSMNNN